MIDFKTWIQGQATQPVMGSLYNQDQYIPIDLSIGKSKIDTESTLSDLFEVISERQLEHLDCLLYGGYMERRGIYQSPLFTDNGDNPRCIHLGTDIWAAASTEIYAPLAGRVHSFQYNDAHLDYGYTVVLHHEVGSEQFYTLYGHLSDFNFGSFEVGRLIHGGEPFCTLGDPEQNGGWPPHLHFQVILDMEGHAGDYPGVVTKDKAEKYSHLCPDPTQLALGF